MAVVEAFETIKGLASADRIRLDGHALVNADECVANVQREGSWRVTGPDIDGDQLTCICVIEDAVVVITLF